MRKTTFLSELESAYQHFKRSYAGLTIDQLQQPGVVEAWSVRDLIAHISWWEEDAIRKSRILLGLDDAPLFPPRTIDEFNASKTREQAAWNLQTIFNQQAQIHRALINFLESLPEEAFDGRTRFIKYLVADTTAHYPEHAAHIDAWRLSTKQTSRRALRFNGMFNPRDLGGLPARDGSVTRFDQFIRADSTSRLSRRGQQELVDRGVKLVVDLRSPQETEAEPSVYDRPDSPIAYRQIPLFSTHPEYMPRIYAAETVAESYQLMLEYCGPSIAESFSAFAACDGPVLFHCTSGKDRTGLISMLLLMLADVDAPEIAADYALSQPALWPLWQTQIAEAGGEEHVHPWYKPLTPAEYMSDTMEHLIERYGSAENYLMKAGLTDHEIATLRARLTGKG